MTTPRGAAGPTYQSRRSSSEHLFPFNRVQSQDYPRHNESLSPVTKPPSTGRQELLTLLLLQTGNFLEKTQRFRKQKIALGVPRTDRETTAWQR